MNADIRRQVTGYLLKQNCAEGSFVRKGQLLFEIDPRPFQAAGRSGTGTTRRGERAIGAIEGTTRPRPKEELDDRALSCGGVAHNLLPASRQFG